MRLALIAQVTFSLASDPRLEGNEMYRAISGPSRGMLRRPESWEELSIFRWSPLTMFGNVIRMSPTASQIYPGDSSLNELDNSPSAWSAASIPARLVENVVSIWGSKNEFLLVPVISSIGGVTSAIVSTISQGSELRSRYTVGSNGKVKLGGEPIKEGYHRDSILSLPLEDDSLEWDESILIGSLDKGLGVLAVSLRSSFARSAGSFSVTADRNLVLGENIPTDQNMYPVTPLGIKRGEWIIDGASLMMGRSSVASSVRINTGMDSVIAVSLMILKAFVDEISEFAMIRMTVSDEGEIDGFFADLDSFDRFPNILLTIPGEIQFTLKPHDYCNPETGQINIATNEFEEELIVDVGLAVLAKVGIRFDSKNARLGFSV